MSLLNNISATQQRYAQLHDEQVYLITLCSGNITVTITNIGCAIMAIETPDKQGRTQNIVAGYTMPDDYLNNPDYFGCVLGRYANRIAGGRLMIGNRQVQLSVNNGPNHLHGGIAGFQQKIWQVTGLIQQADTAGVALAYTSRSGEEGYPGNARVQVTYTLTGNQLQMEYTCYTDEPTPVNLSNHSYFNLTGFEEADIYNHVLQVYAQRYTPKNAQNVPDGSIAPVQGTALDFTLPKRIGTAIHELTIDKGYDHNFVLDKEYPQQMVLAAILTEPVSGRSVKVYTDQPGIQLYTANWWHGAITGRQGKSYRQHGAIALETQAFPDSPNHAHFPGTILQPGQAYHTVTRYVFDHTP